MQDSLRDRIGKELDALATEGGSLVAMLAEAKAGQAKTTFNHFDFSAKYQHWYTRALPVVKALAPDRLREFVNYYEADPKRKSVEITNYRLQDFLAGFQPTPDHFTGKVPYDREVVAQVAAYNQLMILRALTSRLDSVLANLESRIATEVQDAGLASARQLLKVSPRAAGALAGVVLEDHLQRVAAKRGVKIVKKDPTIAEVNDPLKAAQVYDQPTWRRIQFLADIRNLCSHKKSQEPTEPQVQELLDGTAWVVANIN